MITNDSPRGQGYIACTKAQPLESNPYLGTDADIICQWYDWNDGWNQAWYEKHFGVE